MHRARFVLVAVLAGVLAAACGEREEGSPRGSAPAPKSAASKSISPQLARTEFRTYSIVDQTQGGLVVSRSAVPAGWNAVSNVDWKYSDSSWPVRIYARFIAPDGSAKLLPNLPVLVQGIAFSGDGPVTTVEVSADDGKSWTAASLGEDHGPYSFRTWDFRWSPPAPGTYALAVRATDAKGHVQPDRGVWNPGGYLWNKIERQDIVVGTA